MTVTGTKIKIRKLALACIECGLVCHAPYEDERLLQKRLLNETGWVLSLIDPQEGTLAPLCGPCAERIYGPDVLAVAKRNLS